ncbi:MAG: hypothetical protein MZV70_51450, partial [Desulfobacterales bacterium]|nr:hypothetical protein [Desulfobacterales bacterium]
CYLLFPSRTTILSGKMMELNPGMTLSPVHLEIFSSAGRILVFFVAILCQIYIIARIRQTFRFPRRSAELPVPCRRGGRCRRRASLRPGRLRDGHPHFLGGPCPARCSC